MGRGFTLHPSQSEASTALLHLTPPHPPAHFNASHPLPLTSLTRPSAASLLTTLLWSDQWSGFCVQSSSSLLTRCQPQLLHPGSLWLFLTLAPELQAPAAQSGFYSCSIDPGPDKKEPARKNMTETNSEIKCGLWVSVLCIHGISPNSDSCTLIKYEKVFVLCNMDSSS